MEKAAEEGFTVNVWTLCIPVDLDPGAPKWWTGWNKRQEPAHGIRIELRTRTDLETVLLSPDAPRIRSAYFPAVPSKGVVRARPATLASSRLQGSRTRGDRFRCNSEATRESGRVPELL